MKTAVLDTSVIIKWFHQSGEADANTALLLREAYLNGDLKLAIPDLAIYEFANALRFKTRLGPADVAEMVGALWSLGITIHPVDQSLSDSIIDIAYRYGLTVYDAAFVALAQKLAATCITADQKLYENVSDLTSVILLSSLEG